MNLLRKLPGVLNEDIHKMMTAVGIGGQLIDGEVHLDSPSFVLCSSETVCSRLIHSILTNLFHPLLFVSRSTS